MYNYLVYALWLIIPAAVVSALPYVVCVLLCCSVRLQSSTAGMVKFLLGDLVEKKEEDGTKYLIKGHPLKGFFLSMVTVYSFMITSCALMTFWDTFLVDVTYSCDPNFDCYPLPLASITYRSIPPIVNCSDYVTLPDNMTIVCFTFTFDYSQAFGAAGGVFAFAVFGIRIVLGIIIWLKSKCRKYCLVIVLFGIPIAVPIIGSILLVGYILLICLVPVFRPLLVETTRMLYLLVYFMTFGAGFNGIILLFVFSISTPKIENTYTAL